MFLIFILVSCKMEAQTSFEKKYAPSLEQYGREIFNTSDEGFLLQGTIEQGWRNCYFIKTDSIGDTLWTKNYGTDSIQFYTYDMTKTPDGGYLICGDYQEVLTYPSMDSYVQKIDSMGNQVWFNLYGWPTSQNGNKDYAQLIRTLDDGSIIVVGTTRDFYVSIGNYIPVGQGWRSYIAKFDTSGSMLEIKTISLVLDTLWGQDYQAFDLETIGNRIYWLGINSAPYYPNGGGTTLVVFDADLDTTYTISSGLDDYYGLSKTNDNNLILFGAGILTKMDTTGAIAWTEPNISPSFPNEIIEQNNGTFSSVGGSYHISPFFGDFYNIIFPFNEIVYLNIYNDTGTLTGSSIFNPSSGVVKQLGYNLIKTNDNGFAFVGYSDQSIWLVKTDSLGNLNTGLDEQLLDANDIKIIPNPATKTCSIFSFNTISEIAIYNLVGDLIAKEEVNSNSYQINVENYSNAIYFIEVNYNMGKKSRMKLIVSH